MRVQVASLYHEPGRRPWTCSRTDVPHFGLQMGSKRKLTNVKNQSHRRAGDVDNLTLYPNISAPYLPRTARFADVVKAHHVPLIERQVVARLQREHLAHFGDAVSSVSNSNSCLVVAPRQQHVKSWNFQVVDADVVQSGWQHRMPVVFYLSSPQCRNVATKLQANRLSIVNVVDVFPHQCRWTFGSYTNCHHQHQQQQQQQHHREVFVVCCQVSLTDVTNLQLPCAYSTDRLFSTGLQTPACPGYIQSGDKRCDLRMRAKTCITPEANDRFHQFNNLEHSSGGIGGACTAQLCKLIAEHSQSLLLVISTYSPSFPSNSTAHAGNVPVS
ncbi:hypothetical protein T06_5670 [Trichinella sp. T6]|nr:hypothetical protein T06_5670 [Trichinella sp. T6]